MSTEEIMTPMYAEKVIKNNKDFQLIISRIVQSSNLEVFHYLILHKLPQWSV